MTAHAMSKKTRSRREQRAGEREAPEREASRGLPQLAARPRKYVLRVVCTLQIAVRKHALKK